VKLIRRPKGSYFMESVALPLASSDNQAGSKILTAVQFRFQLLASAKSRWPNPNETPYGSTYPKAIRRGALSVGFHENIASQVQVVRWVSRIPGHPPIWESPVSHASPSSETSSPPRSQKRSTHFGALLDAAG
jgi:hypothetical protein